MSANHDDGLLQEFVREAFELIGGAGTACAEFGRSGDSADHREIIDRALHTLKGNAAALGFEELSKTSSFVLDHVRADDDLDRAHIALVLRFVSMARQWMFLLKNGRTPPDGFFGTIINDPPVSIVRPRNPAAVAGRPSADWEREVDEILASAPDVNPDLDQLVELAVRQLDVARPTDDVVLEVHPVDEEPEVAMPEIPVDLDSPATREEPDSLDGYGFEAWRLQQILGDTGDGKGSKRALAEARGFLAEFSRWISEQRRVPVETAVAAYLGDAPESCRLECRGVRVLPGVGELMGVLLRGIVVAAPSGSSSAVVKVDRCDSLLRATVHGLSDVRKALARARLREYSTFETLQETGGSIETDGDSVVLTIPDDRLFEFTVLIIRIGSNRLAVPLHRVLHVEESDASELTGEEPLELDGEAVPVLDLRWTRAPRREPDPGRCVVFLRGDEGNRAIVADRLVCRRDMLVRTGHGTGLDSHIVGTCLSIDDGAHVPLIGPALS